LIGGELVVDNVSKDFDSVRVLKNANLKIKPGEFFSLLGPSGCGKTTLLRIIAGFEYPSEGLIYLDGKNIIDKSPNNRHINTVFQNYALFPHLSVFENVAFSMRLKKESNEKIRKKVTEYLALVKLEEHIKKMPSQLSGGQKQRVAIARALINEPSVLLLDEPLSALDAKLRQQLLIELDAIHDEIGITFIYVTHDQQEALSVSDRIAVMDRAEVLQVGTPFEIYENPANSFIANFIGETNNIKGTVKNIDGDIITIETDSYGDFKIFKDKEVSIGDKVKVTIRPEKIRISRERPNDNNLPINVLTGRIDELIYSGFQTKYYVTLDINGSTFKVFKQHIKYFMDDTPFNWKENVLIWWYAKDSFLIEVKK